MNYEHTCEVVSSTGDHDGYFNFESIEVQTQKVLAGYSSDGWELVSVVAGDNARATKVMLFFKRPRA